MKILENKYMLIFFLMLVAVTVVGQDTASQGKTVGEEFITFDALKTLGGAVMAVYVVTNVFKFLNIWRPAYVSLTLSFVMVFAVAYASNKTEMIDYVIALVNGCLLFTNAIGLNETANAIAKNGRDGQTLMQGKTSNRWFSSWVT